MDEIDSRILRTRTAHVLLNMYRCLGGVFYEYGTTTNNWKLKSGLLLLRSTILFYASLCTICIVDHFVVRKDEFLNSWRTLPWYAVVPGTTVLYGLIDCHNMYYSQKNFVNMIKAIDNNFGLPTDTRQLSKTPQQSYSEFDLKKWSFISCVVMGLALVIDIIAWPVSFLTVAEKFNKTLDVTVPTNLLPHFYKIPAPYILNNHVTFEKFLLVHSIRCFLEIYGTVMYFGLYMFSFIVVCSAYNSVVSLANVFNYQSRDLCWQMEKSPDFFIGGKNLCLQLECITRCKEYIMYHRTLKEHVEDIRKFIQFNYSVVMMQMFLCYLPWTCVVLLDENMSIWSRISDAAGLIFVPTCLFLICFCGKMCEEMCEMMLLEAYNVPWYHCTPPQRKIITQTLCFFQQPIHFKGLKIYPMSMSSWPRIMHACYSILSTIRVIDSSSI